MCRPGTLSFATELEHEFFPPDTDENELYSIFQLKYCGMPHFIIEIPRHSFKIAETLSKKCGLNMVNGKPTSTKSTDPPFGLICNSVACFTLETDHQQEKADEWAKQLQDEQVRVMERLKMTETDICNEQESN
jgi:hypothetical protein